jgi:hypothetical protein
MGLSLSDTHRFAAMQMMGFASAQPILRALQNGLSPCEAILRRAAR